MQSGTIWNAVIDSDFSKLVVFCLLHRSVRGGRVRRGEWARGGQAWNILFGEQEKKNKFHSKYTWRMVFKQQCQTSYYHGAYKQPKCVTQPANTPKISQSKRSSQDEPRQVKTKFLGGGATTTTTLLTPIAQLSFSHGAQQLRQRCRCAGNVYAAPLLRAKSAGCLSACNPVQRHRSRETRVEWRPTSASSCGQILDLLRNPRRSWTALYLFILNNRKRTVDPRTRGTDAERKDAKQKLSDGNTVGNWQHTGTLSDCAFSDRSFGKTGFSRCVKAERSSTFPCVFFLVYVNKR